MPRWRRLSTPPSARGIRDGRTAMTQESLRELLARLHERLGGSATLDRESRALLGTVMRDIERALAPGAGLQADAAALMPAAAHAPRLESLAVRFEAGHPGLAELLRELIDALGKAGI
ncbi:MAG: DUF4404 family protein [Gammaproteobacteria bacterium]|nr:MAG: DUF4404 family protein [Gammaproteobacteria bacterium]TLY63558.1 MAG: DUF4404 family protein [Gammaproteobacteria bacterium]TLY80865.1 MAG: DUF4404 family protein [Gammaproteobacteria bacterium]TLZ52122.1 MAG: DUF4404 family protein [Gammaproteobacteria bacterium]TLZ63176.1 MAG: DUF4404 family protein [Gammaproteobacteria bacterium]